MRELMKAINLECQFQYALKKGIRLSYPDNEQVSDNRKRQNFIAYLVWTR